MKNKTLYLILPILMATILAVTLVSATTTLNVPLTGSNWSTTINLNCTTDLPEPLNATLWYNVTGGSAATYLTGSLTLNDTASDTEFNKTGISISSFTDATTYNFTCLVANGTATEYSVGRISIAKDATAPVISLSIKQEAINPNGLFEAQCSYTDATTGTTSASYFQASNPSGTATTLTADGTYQTTMKDSKTALEGTYTWTCYAIDYSGNTATSTEYTYVQGVGITVEQSTGGFSGILHSKAFWILVIIGAVIYFNDKNKK